MKTRNIFYLALAFMALSCAKEIAPETENTPDKEINYVQKEFTAGIGTFGEAGTKTGMVNGFQIEWKKNDGVTVIDNVANTAVKYTASVAGKTTTLTTATEGVADNATEFYAAYPWRDGNNALVLENGDELKNCYLTPDQRPSRNGYYASVHYAMAKADALDNFQFKNANGFIRFTVSDDLKDQVKAIYIFSNNDEEIAGAFKMKWNGGDVKAVYAGGSSKRTFVRAYNANGTAFSPGDYFLGIIPTTFEKGFTAVLQLLDGTQLYKRTEKKITVAEGQILPMKTLAKADYSTDDTNYFVLYNEGFDVTINGFVINDSFKNADGTQVAATIVSKQYNENMVNGKNNIYFITPYADDVVIGGYDKLNYAVIGMSKKYRTNVDISADMSLAENATGMFCLANLTVTNVNDESIIRGFPKIFDKLLINNCAFKNMTRHLIDIHNGTTADGQSSLYEIRIEDSEICFANCNNDYSIVQRSQKDLYCRTFKFVNNVVTSTGSETKKFRLLHGYGSSVNKGVTVNDWTVRNNTFHNTLTTSLASVAGIQDVFLCQYNLFVFPVTYNNIEPITIYQKPDTDRVVPASGWCVENYYYSTGTDYKWVLGNVDYLKNLPDDHKKTPIALTVSPLSSIWNPVQGKFGAYTLNPAPAEGVKVGAQRADMTPVTAALDSPAANYVNINLGNY